MNLAGLLTATICWMRQDPAGPLRTMRGHIAPLMGGIERDVGSSVVVETLDES